MKKYHLEWKLHHLLEQVLLQAFPSITLPRSFFENHDVAKLYLAFRIFCSMEPVGLKSLGGPKGNNYTKQPTIANIMEAFNSLYPAQEDKRVIQSRIEQLYDDNGEQAINDIDMLSSGARTNCTNGSPFTSGPAAHQQRAPKRHITPEDIAHVEPNEEHPHMEAGLTTTCGTERIDSQKKNKTACTGQCSEQHQQAHVRINDMLASKLPDQCFLTITNKIEDVHAVVMKINGSTPVCEEEDKENNSNIEALMNHAWEQMQKRLKPPPPVPV